MPKHHSVGTVRHVFGVVAANAAGRGSWIDAGITGKLMMVAAAAAALNCHNRVQKWFEVLVDEAVEAVGVVEAVAGSEEGEGAAGNTILLANNVLESAQELSQRRGLLVLVPIPPLLFRLPSLHPVDSIQMPARPKVIS